MADTKVDLLNVDSSEIEEQRIMRATDTSAASFVVRNQVSPVGTTTSGALATQQLVSTTGAQIITTRDCDLYTLVTFDATNNVASVKVELSPDNTTYSELYTASIAAAVNNTGAIAIPTHVRVPAAWYVKMTTVHATLGLSTKV